MKQSVNVLRSSSQIVVTSVSRIEGSGFAEDGWTTLLATDAADADAVGAAVVEGLGRCRVISSAELPPLGGTGRSVASDALGYPSANALLADGVPLVAVTVKNGRTRVSPMVNEGAGRGWSGQPDLPEVVHEGDWPEAELGAAVIAGLDAADAARAKG